MSVTGFNRRRREMVDKQVPAPAHVPHAKLAQMNKAELQALAKSLQLDTAGTNDALRDRIKAAQDASAKGGV